MNIALFPSAFAPSVGGVEELCRQLALEYRARGWSVCVLTNRWPRVLPQEEEIDGIPVFRLPFRTPDAGWRSYLTYVLTSQRTRRTVRKILIRNKVDLLHVQCVGCNAHYAGMAARDLSLPLIISLQGELTMDASGLFRRSAFARRTLNSALRTGTWITACSQQTLNEALEWSQGFAPSRARVIRNGVKCADFIDVGRWSHPRPYVLGVGRQVREKGFDVLIEAMNFIWKSGEWDGDLVLAGDGPENGGLKELVRRLGVESRVSFLGSLGRREVAEVFAGAALFALPSRHEPFGIVNLEAMAAGKAVVASCVGGVPEIIKHEHSGWLVPADDPPALARGVLHLLRDPALCSSLAKQGHLVAKAHDWSSVTDEYELVYKSAISVS